VDEHGKSRSMQVLFFPPRNLSSLSNHCHLRKREEITPMTRPRFNPRPIENGDGMHKGKAWRLWKQTVCIRQQGTLPITTYACCPWLTALFSESFNRPQATGYKQQAPLLSKEDLCPAWAISTEMFCGRRVRSKLWAVGRLILARLC
jgi:hypothetical protein